MEREISNKENEKGMDILSECLAGLFYSDEEIKATMSPEDADEFIELRNEFLHNSKTSISRSYNNEDADLPMAAEDSASY